LKNAAKALFFLSAVFLLAVTGRAADDFYQSLTNTADFNYRPVFQEREENSNDFFEDVKVTMVESIPFAFLYTLAGIYIYNAVEQGTLSPSLPGVDDSAHVYTVVLPVTAAVSTLFNLLAYYEY